MNDIDRIGALEARILKLERIIAGLSAVFGGMQDGATDRELDGQYGNPEVRVIPKSWASRGIAKGQRYSQYPPDFLEDLADTFEYFAQKNEETGAKTNTGKLKAPYDRKNARLARGWARRLRAGWKPPPPPERPTFGGNTTPSFNTRPAPFGSKPNSYASSVPDQRAFGDANHDDEADFPYGANDPDSFDDEVNGDMPF